MILSILMGMYNHSQSTQNKKFTIQWQYLRKEVRDGVCVLYANKHQNVYMLALSILIEVARHFESTQIGKLVIFLQCVKKKVSKLILCSTVMQNIQIFYRGPVMFVVTCSLLSSMLMYHNFQEKLKKHYEKCTLNVLAISENSAENHKVMTA